MRYAVRVGYGLGLLGLLSAGLVWWHSALAAEAGAPKPPSGPSCQDLDHDGYGPGCARGPDCNDQDATVHPGQVEVCNYRDDDCNGWVDDASACPVAAADRRPVKVAAGDFWMGSGPAEGANDERPRHRLWISGFRIDAFEVTNRRYHACAARGVCQRPKLLSSRLRSDYYENERYADYPVIFVDFYQAESFCRQVGGRLPTEAEWEKAARGPAPSVREFPWGDQAPDCTLANLGGPRGCVGDTDQVGRRVLGQSPSGAYDMAGNVWEWVSDWYDPAYYAASPARDPSGPSRGTLKLMRGGCWESGASSLRVSCRKPSLPSTWANNVGFRCAYGEEG
jgi:formylglycine-generating enzyme required for sulfatase activity